MPALLQSIKETAQRLNEIKSLQVMPPPVAVAGVVAQAMATPKYDMTVYRLTPEEAKAKFGIDLPTGIRKATFRPNAKTGQYDITLFTVDDWTIYPGQTYRSPTGIKYTQAELDTAIAAQGQAIAPLKYMRLNRETGKVEQVTEQQLTTYNPPPTEIDLIKQWAMQKPDEFATAIVEGGRTPETESIVKQVWPDITRAELDMILPPAGSLVAESVKYVAENPPILGSKKEGLLKDFWDAIKSGGENIIYSVQQTFRRTILNDILQPVKVGDLIPGPEGFIGRYTQEQAKAENTRVEQQTTEFQTAYDTAVKVAEDYRKAHPEQQPVYPQGFLNTVMSDPSKLLDGTLYAETIGQTIPYTVGLMAIGLLPEVGVPLSFAVTWATEGQDIYDSAIANGATPKQAQGLAEVYGFWSSCVETVGDTFFVQGLGATSKVFSKLLGREVAKETAEAVLKKTGWQVTKQIAKDTLIDFLNQGGQEAIEQVIRNAAVRTVNANQPLLQDAMQSFVGGVVGTIPFEIIGVGSQVFQMIRAKPATYLSTTLQQKMQAEVANLTTQGLSQDIAEETALDKILHTDEGKSWLQKVAPQIQAGLRQLATQGTGGIGVPAPLTIAKWDAMPIAERTTVVNQAVINGVPMSERIASKAGIDLTAAELMAIQQVTKTQPAVAPEQAVMPQQVVGTPEVGVQKDIFGNLTPVTPKGKGVVTQISMEEQAKLQQARETAAEVPPTAPGLATEPIAKAHWVELPQGIKAKAGQETQTDINTGKTYVWLEAGQKLVEATGVPPGGKIPPEITAVTPTPATPPPSLSAQKRIAAFAAEQVRQDMPGVITNLVQKVPGLKQVLQFERPGLKMTGENQSLLTAMNAGSMALPDVATREFATRLSLLDELSHAFGKDVLHGKEKSAIHFLGTEEQARNPLVGTLLDIIQRAPLYDLNATQKRALLDYDSRNKVNRAYVIDGYGLKIGEYQMKSGGYYIQNTDVGEDVVGIITSTEERAVTQGRGKTRIWDTAAERIEGKTKFTPELDVQKLIEGIDRFNAEAAGNEAYRSVLGGLNRLEVMQVTHPELYDKMTGLHQQLQKLLGYKSILTEQQLTALNDFFLSPHEDADLAALDDAFFLHAGRYVAKAVAGSLLEDINSQIDNTKALIRDLRPTWRSANLKPYIFVQNSLYQYFKADMANLIKESIVASNGRFDPTLRFIEGVRGGRFSGDFSPLLGVQTPLGLFADPIGSVQAAAGAIKKAGETGDALRVFKIRALAQDIAADLPRWTDFFSLLGRAPSGVPAEYAAGFLSKIPGFDAASEAIYIPVTRQSFDLWNRLTHELMQSGIDKTTATVAAIDKVMEVYPLLNPSRLGQSKATTALLRAAATSYAFIRQPISLTTEAVKGYIKYGTGQWNSVTPRERLSVKLITIMALSLLTTSALSAMISAKARGKPDDEVYQAGLDAINPDPNNGNFLTLVIGDLKIPIGGPYRAIFRAIYPAEVKGVPFPVPFAGFPTYLANRITPFVKTQIELLLNKDYYGRPIMQGDFPERVLRAVEYEIENVFPLTISSIAESIRTGQKWESGLQQAIGQFLGVNISQRTADRINELAQDSKNAIGQVKDPHYLELTKEKPPLIDTSGWSADIKKLIGSRPLEEITAKNGYSKDVLLWVAKENDAAKQNIIPNIKLRDINTDTTKGDTISEYYAQWLKRQLITDPDALKAFDADYPYAKYGNITSAQYDLLKEYQALDASGQAQFLKDHPELSLNPRIEWLKNNPEANGRLALFGEAPVLTQAAYDYAIKMAAELSIPVNGFATFLPPKEVAKASFEYLDAVNKFGGGSSEVMLVRAENPALNTWLGLEDITTPIDALKLRVEPIYAATYDKLHKDTDPEYIRIHGLDDKLKDENGLTARDRAIADLNATKIGNLTYKDIDRKITAIEEGLVNYDLQNAWVKVGQLVDKTSSSSPEVKQFLLQPENKGLLTWASTKKNPVYADWQGWDIRVIDIDVKYKKEDAWYDGIGKRWADRTDADILSRTIPPDGIDPDRWASEDAATRRGQLASADRDQYLKGGANKEYWAATLQREAYKVDLPEEFIQNYVEYYQLPDYGSWRDRYRQEHPAFEQAFKDARLAKGYEPLSKLPDQIRSAPYDMIYEEYKNDFVAYDKIKGDAVAADAYFIAHPDFYKAWYRRQAYEIYLPEKFVDLYVEDKTTKWKSNFAQARFWQKNQGYYSAMTAARNLKSTINFDLIPSEEVENLYNTYQDMPSSSARKIFRRNNPMLDIWLQRMGITTELAGKGPATSRVYELNQSIADTIAKLEELRNK